MRSVLRLYAGSMGKCRIQPVGMGTGPLLSRARNELLNMFMKGDANGEPYDYFLWADTDIIFGYEDLAVLLQSDKDIAGSVYFALNRSSESFVVALKREEGSPGTFGNLKVDDCYESDGRPKDPIRVDGLGCGFTLIKRSVIESLAPIKRLWPYAESGEEEGYGEDLTFCLRAAEKGHESWLVPLSQVGHIKEIVL